ncbi:hypothetical protein MYK68_15590 [Gordonia sp. PP30]|uniref:hypothetical protein n=1 Tax=Gordonia sp. PP30 TaxID=2935861 RepID=UPI001FFF9BD8|nr:hypothetical protein [Gordonia sp. PP30]UQE74138.1 hypothetical protein MYK68_15590 [Gordonia sp. PP30]
MTGDAVPPTDGARTADDPAGDDPAADDTAGDDATGDDAAALRERVAELEARNAALTAAAAPRSHRGLRTTACLVLAVVALLLTPVAVVGTWARLQMVDANRFVSTFGPLASDPDMQKFLTETVSDRIEQQLDLPARVGELFDSIQDSGMPPRAASAVGLLEAPTVAGLRGFIDNTVERVVTSDRFADLWAASLRLSHQHVVAVLEDDPKALAELSDDGVLSLRLDPVIDAVKQQLAGLGLPFVDRIQITNQIGNIPIVRSRSLGLARTVYTTAVIGGYWLPWVVLALLAGAVLIAVSPRRALSGVAAAFAVVCGFLIFGLWIGKTAFVHAVSPRQVPGAVADVLFTQVTTVMQATVVALTVFGALVAIAAWFAGPARPARAMREVAIGGFGLLRGALDAHGGDTGRVGAWVQRWRFTVVTLAVIGGCVALVAARPVTLGSVVWFVVGLSVLVVAIELIRRPVPPTMIDHDG